jgi:serine protease Do
MTQFTDRARSPKAKALAAALLITTILGGGVATPAWSQATVAPPVAAPSTVPAPYGIPQLGFADLADKVKPAVVNISTQERVGGGPQADMRNLPKMPKQMEEMFRRYFEQQQRGQGGDDESRGRTKRSAGSGFIIDPAGWIVTNNHVIDGATKITVTTDDGSSYQATVKGRDDKVDLALLKIEASRPLPYLPFGNSDAARVGDWVIAVGNPFGLGGSVTAGIISAHNRNLHAGPYDDFLQIDAPINPGNSGGPLFNQQGQVIGISTAIYSPTGGSVGIGFAIPSNLVSKVVSELRQHGTVNRGWLGVQMQPMTDQLARAMGRPNADGVLINRVEDDSPAARAKLQQGDVITAFGNRAIKSPRDLAVAVGDTKAGQSARMTVWRDGKEQTVNVTVGAPKPADKQASASSNDNDDQSASGRAAVGLALAPLSNEKRKELDLPPTAKGVVVQRVTPDSQAAESGIERGDVIVRIGDDAVSTPAEAIAKIRKAQDEKRAAVPLLVMREGATYYVALQLARG